MKVNGCCHLLSKQEVFRAVGDSDVRKRCEGRDRERKKKDRKTRKQKIHDAQETCRCKDVWDAETKTKAKRKRVCVSPLVTGPLILTQSSISRKKGTSIFFLMLFRLSISSLSIFLRQKSENKEQKRISASCGWVIDYGNKGI